jgi:predicted ribosome quality control (RQC) complex YloA/Tae2 family protein
MIDNSQDLITTLKSQHRKLQSDLSLVSDELKSNNTPNATLIASDLSIFKKDLLEHINLEGKIFYPDYISKQNLKGYDTTHAKEFIADMTKIGEVVMAFLDKYMLPKVIESYASDFKNELQNIISTLNTRIEAEEDGIFSIYLAL